MEKKKMSGFSPVFKYTLKSQMKSPKYITITAVFALLIIIALGLVIVITSKPEEEAEFNIKEVTVCDETGLGVADYSMYAEMLENENVSKVKFSSCDKADKFLEDNAENSDYILVVQTENDEGFLLEVVTAEDNEYNMEVLDELATTMTEYFQMHIYNNSGLSEEALTQALFDVSYKVTDYGEEEDDVGKFLVNMLVTMLFLMVVYFMVLLYGAQICTEVSMEKTSKLVEQLLISVTPYGLVSGKILALISSSIIQFVIWIVSVFIGIFGGDKIASIIYEDYESKFGMYLNYLTDWFGEMAFDPVGIALAVLIMIAGLVFYLVIAGVAGSMVTKPEDAGNVQIIFVLPLIIAFFAILPAIVAGEGSVAMFYHFIPFTAAMVTPGAVLFGDVSLLMGLISLLICIVGSMLLLLLAAKVYKALLFFNGKSIWAVFKKNKKQEMK